MVFRFSFVIDSYRNKANDNRFSMTWFSFSAHFNIKIGWAWRKNTHERQWYCFLADLINQNMPETPKWYLPSVPHCSQDRHITLMLFFFFLLKACRLSNERPLTPCPVEGLNKSECSRIRCCPFKIGQDEQCYMPVRDGECAAASEQALLNMGPKLIKINRNLELNELVLPGIIQYTSIDFRGDIPIFRMSWLNTDVKPQGYCWLTWIHFLLFVLLQEQAEVKIRLNFFSCLSSSTFQCWGSCGYYQLDNFWLKKVLSSVIPSESVS